jgi:uncharacterized membrane protein
VFLSYVLSFIYLAIYWNNHHHLMQAARHINGRVLWANQHLLFWLSLIPFVTAWMGENHFATWPVATYGAVLLACAVAYTILVRSLLALHGRDSALARAIGRDGKGNVSLFCYALAVAVAFANRYLSMALYAAVALMWLIPDPRIESTLIRQHKAEEAATTAPPSAEAGGATERGEAERELTEGHTGPG